MWPYLSISRLSRGGLALSRPHRSIGRPPRLFAGLLNGDLSDFFCLCAGFALGPDFLEFIMGQMFNSNEGITSRADADQFIELDLDRGAVAVLGIKNTIKNVTIVVPVLMTSCQVSE